MTHQNLLDILRKHNLTKEDFFKLFDYSPNTLSSNYKKNQEINPKITKNFEIFLELNALREKNLKLQKELDSSKKHKNINFLSDEIINLAKKKSSSLGISLEHYISSLIISNS